MLKDLKELVEDHSFYIKSCLGGADYGIYQSHLRALIRETTETIDKLREFAK
jgi:hypothetical protein